MRKKTIVDIAEFRRRVARGHKPGVAVRFATEGAPEAAADERAVTFVFSDSSVDRYGDTIDARGWALDNFRANPVVLFGHDSGSVENVIGRAHNLRVQGEQLVGDIEFMTEEVNPQAETVYRMVKGGFLKTVSVGFLPLEWAATKDKARPGGIDFRKQELMEVSIVPIPANPNALAQAKAAGIDVDRLGLVVADAPKIAKRGLYEVSWLADLLASLGYLADCVAWEAEYEGDGSEVPQQLTDALKQLGQVLIDMTAEEVAELLADHAEDDAEGEEDPLIETDDPVEMAALSPAQRALVKLAAIGRRARSLASRQARSAAVQSRAGKVLSAANEQCLRDAHGMMTKACEIVMGLVEANQPDESEDPETIEDAAKAAQTAMRQRLARARKTKLRLAASRNT